MHTAPMPHITLGNVDQGIFIDLWCDAFPDTQDAAGGRGRGRAGAARGARARRVKRRADCCTKCPDPRALPPRASPL
jgi:hypothetical protein